MIRRSLCDVLNRLAHVGGALGDALHGLLADQVQGDRDVVGPEAPEGVLVGPQLAEVESVAVDVVEVAQLAGVDQLLQAGDCRVVLEQVPDHQDAPGLLGGGDGPFGIGGARRQRLLDEAVLA